MNSNTHYIRKELNWLFFNERVLQEAADKSVPVIERFRFLGIFSNNLDEFYQTQFAELKNNISLENQAQDKQLLSAIQTKISQLNSDFEQYTNDVLLELAHNNIYMLNETQLDKNQLAWVSDFFNRKLLSVITPIFLQSNSDLLSLLTTAPYLSVELKKKGQETQYALIEIPLEYTKRFIQLPTATKKRQHHFILVDNIIRLYAKDIFKHFYDFDSINIFAIKITRDGNCQIKHKRNQLRLKNVTKGLKARASANAVRFVYQKEMPKKMQNLLGKMLNLDKDAISFGDRYINYFPHFPDISIKHLEHKQLPCISSASFEHHVNYFQAIKHSDILLYYPYHSFSHMTQLLHQASLDSAVKEIKMVIYRVAKNSRIMKSLINAAKNGKKVTVMIELLARFDESANIAWAKKLKAAGINVQYGEAKFKMHAKLCLISRLENEKICHYAHVGTGNFNETTAHVYSDFSLFTADSHITREIEQLFAMLEGENKSPSFNHLLVSPLNARTQISAMIEREIDHAKAKRKAGITIKLNNLVDPQIIDLLYKASQAGVKIRLIIRGMCSLVPGVKGLSDNIKAISIVDRFLEHPRIMAFENGGENQLYISSADWMKRNLDHRVEVGIAINDKQLKQRILAILDIQFADNTKARIIDSNQSNQYVTTKSKRKIRSQIKIYQYLKQTELKQKQLMSKTK